MGLIRFNAKFPMYINSESVDAIVQDVTDAEKTSVFMSGSDEHFTVDENIETVRVKLEHRGE